MQQLASLEAHDLGVARWLDEATQDEWDNCGDHMEQPVNIAELRQNKMKGFLTFGGNVQGCNAGLAALLRAESGMADTTCPAEHRGSFNISSDRTHNSSDTLTLSFR